MAPDWTQSYPAGHHTGTLVSAQTISGLDFGAYPAAVDIPGDVTGDNIVDQADYTVWYNHYGQTGGNVPEPMTMALLAIGGLAILRRKK